MDGEDESLNLATKTFNNLKGKSDAFDHTIGFPANPSQVEECPYLNLKQSDIIKYTPEQCGQVAVDLASYAIYVQRILSKNIAHLHWIESKINLAVANDIMEFQGYYSFEQKKHMAIIGNPYAKQLEELRINTQVKVDSLSNIPYQINQLIKTLLEMQSIKRYQKNG